jgi:hypothetical protein
MKTIPFTESEIKEIKEHYTHELERLQKRANEIRGILQKMEGKDVKDIINIATSVTEEKGKIDKKEVANKVKGTAGKSIASKPANANSALSQKKKTNSSKTEKTSVVKTNVPVTKKISVPNAKKQVITVVKSVKKGKTAKQSTNTKTSKDVAIASSKTKKTNTSKTEKTGAVKKGRAKSPTSKHAIYESFIVEYITKQNKLISSKSLLDTVEKEFKIPAADYSKMKATVTVILSKTKAGGRIKDYPQPGTKTKLYGLIDWFDNSGKVKDLSKLK